MKEEYKINATNAVESIDSSFRKVTKKGAFPTENALLKLLYLRITELYKKWNSIKVQNWAMVRNQLATNDKIKARMEKYEHLISRYKQKISLDRTVITALSRLVNFVALLPFTVNYYLLVVTYLAFDQLE